MIFIMIFIIFVSCHFITMKKTKMSDVFKSIDLFTAAAPSHRETN